MKDYILRKIKYKKDNKYYYQYLDKRGNKIESDFISMASMKTWINEEDIGNMCAYLISDDANKISGQVIAVDGNAERMD